MSEHSAEQELLGVAIERVLADADMDLTDDEVIKVRDDLLALFYGEMTSTTTESEATTCGMRTAGGAVFDPIWPTTDSLAYCPDHGTIVPGDGHCPYLLMSQWAPACARHPERPNLPAGGES